MRIVLAAVIGGLVMTLWGAFANMVVPIGQMSMKAPVAEDTVLAAVKQGLPAEQGIYVLPHFNESMRKDPAVLDAFSVKMKTSPYAFIVYAPEGRDGMAMGMNILHQWISDTLAALIMVLVMLRAGTGASRGLVIGLAFGVFTWLSLAVPFWNWYRFPAGFIFGTLVEQAVGWTLAGLAIGWWLGRRRFVTPAVQSPRPG